MSIPASSPFSSRPRSALARGAAIAMLALGVAACSGGSGHNYQSSRYTKKGDTKPHSGVAKAHTMPVHGIDVSKYQGDIDWYAVRDAGTQFAFIKATEGGDHIDEKFRQNWNGAKAAGVPYGAYHFTYWCRSPEEQMQWMKQNIPVDPNALPPVLDLEWNAHSRTCPRRLDSDTARRWVHHMLTEMERHFGKKPIIYTDITFHRDVLEGHFNEYKYFLRSVASHPSEKYSRNRWSFWQYTATGTVPGIRGHVDRNVFYGSEDQWLAFLDGKH
ncbi:MAG: glycoside hydrolase family 25 protein [Beijerinckiaceae bacterium]